jgi:predicted DNA-binding transcriptional regulator AlpA
MMGKLLQFDELKEIKGIPWTRQYLSKLEKRGKFPRRILLGDKAVVWDEAEIDAHLNAKRAARDAPPSAPPRRVRRRA